MIYLKLFLNFLKIGLFSFGGAFGMLPLIEETVVTNNWLSASDFYSFVGVCESTPGPIAVNIATYVGSIQGGILGSIIATLGVILPSFIIILLIASILKNIIKNKYVQYFLNGVNPVVIALILSTGISLLFNNIGISISDISLNIAPIVIFLCLAFIYCLFYVVKKKKISSITMIILSAILGIVICSILKI